MRNIKEALKIKLVMIFNLIAVSCFAQNINNFDRAYVPFFSPNSNSRVMTTNENLSNSNMPLYQQNFLVQTNPGNNLYPATGQIEQNQYSATQYNQNNMYDRSITTNSERNLRYWGTPVMTR